VKVLPESRKVTEPRPDKYELGIKPLSDRLP